MNQSLAIFTLLFASSAFSAIPEDIEAYPQFVRWIDTDWQEVEV